MLAPSSGPSHPSLSPIHNYIHYQPRPLLTVFVMYYGTCPPSYACHLTPSYAPPLPPPLMPQFSPIRLSFTPFIRLSYALIRVIPIQPAWRRVLTPRWRGVRPMEPYHHSNGNLTTTSLTPSHANTRSFTHTHTLYQLHLQTHSPTNISTY